MFVDIRCACFHVRGCFYARRRCPLLGRNKILASLCPQVYGLATVKLATALLLIGGVPRGSTRGHLHMLIVGDPGTGAPSFLGNTSFSDIIYPSFTKSIISIQHG
jgi:hypothetical protein